MEGDAARHADAPLQASISLPVRRSLIVDPPTPPYEGGEALGSMVVEERPLM